MRFFLIGLIIIIFSSCLSEPDCLVTASNSVKLVFKNAHLTTPKFVKFPIIYSSGTDAIFVADSVSHIELYVDPRSTQTTFKFQGEDDKIDSVTLKYKIQNILISPECGAYPYYSGLQVIAYTFSDTVRVLSPTLSNDSTAQNVEIKF